MLVLVLLVFALVLLIISGLVNPAVEPWRWRLMCFGLACAVGAEILRVAPLLNH